MRMRMFPLPMARGLRQPVHAQDLARAALAALDTPAAAMKVLPIGGGERVSVGEMFARVRRSLPVDTLPLPLPAWSLRVARYGVARLRGPLSRLDDGSHRRQYGSDAAAGHPAARFSPGCGLLAPSGVICPSQRPRTPLFCHGPRPAFIRPRGAGPYDPTTPDRPS